MTKFFQNTETDIPCPNCAPSPFMIVRTNQQSGSQFLACPNWPECYFTRPIPEDWKMRAAGQAGLFDEEKTK